MQRLLKRTAQAQRQAARRARQHAKRMEVGNQAQTKDSIRQAVNEVKENAKEARAALRDAWEMGPIAPKRDAFIDYGVIKSRLRQDWSNFGTRSTNPKVVEQRCAWAGTPKQLNLAAGDRVVILDGPDQGKIDTIKEVNAETGTLQLEKYNQVSSLSHQLLSLSLLTESPLGPHGGHVQQPPSIRRHAHQH